MLHENEVYVYQQKNGIGYKSIDYDLEKTLYEALSFVVPGDKVVIKPNFVRQCSLNSSEWIHVITNPELIREVLVILISKLDGKGEINILDAPQEDSDFEMLVRNIGLKSIVKEIQKSTSVPINIIDIRTERKKSLNGVIVSRKKQIGDPLGYVTVELAETSSFTGKKNKNYYGADYNVVEAQEFHNDNNNSYVIAKNILACDVFINMPKIKTHKIGGMTCCLKNAVGIIGVKNCIPHHTTGIPENDGDTVPFENVKAKTENRAKNFARTLLNKNIPLIGYFFAFAKAVMQPFLGKNFSVIRNGHWFGNDTLWRAILDLNKIILYADKEGIMQDSQQRQYIAIIDGIVAGEKNGPMAPEPKECGVVAIAKNPLIGDTVISKLMGFDYRKIPSIYKGYELISYRLNGGFYPEDIKVISNNENWSKEFNEIKKDVCFSFEPAFGWKGHIEL